MKQQIFIDDIHEYDYHFLQTGSGNIHTLYYSNTGEWSEHLKGMAAISIKDDGNCLTTGLIISIEDDGHIFTASLEEPLKTIDYSQAERLFIILKLINSPAKYEIGTKKLL